MKVTLRTHILIAAVLLAAFGATSAALYWYRTEVEANSERAFRQDIRLLTLLSRLRAQARQADVLSQVYAQTKSPLWLASRRRAVGSAQAISNEMAVDVDRDPPKTILAELSRQLRDTFAPARADRAKMDELLETMTVLGEVAALDLDRNRALIEQAGARRFYIRTLLECIGIAFVAWYLFQYALVPLLELERSARSWTLGRPWDVSVPPSIPEVAELSRRFSELAGRLNVEYSREKELNVFKTKLVSLVSHEFGNALTIIRNAAFLLEEKVAPAERAANRPLFQMISAQTSSLAGAVNNLLSMSRLEAGKMAVDFSATRLDELLRATVERLESLAEKKNLSLTLDLPHEPVAARADQATLSLAVGNLLSNAIKYTPENGSIALGIEKNAAAPGFCLVYVQDSGIGISEPDAARILSGYYRTESGKKMTAKGFGIGLSLSRQIIEAHGSRLELESSPGKGSRFSFLLPLWPNGGNPV